MSKKKHYTYLRDETGAFDIPVADKPIVEQSNTGLRRSFDSVGAEEWHRACRHSPLRIPALNDAENPQELWLDANVAGDPGVYNELEITAYKGTPPQGCCIADVLVGLNEAGELRVLITTDGDGDGDHQIAVYPQRPADRAVEFSD